MSDVEDVEAAPPAAPPAAPAAPSFASDGDWTCEDCGNVNFARRTSCNRCSKERSAAEIAAQKRKLGTEIGKAAAEKSKGLFSADDWQCNKCGNVNWARRQQCNVCNAPKFGDVEERTGFGGGYNDRGIVEYKEHHSDSDDEYDEFGRRKKKGAPNLAPPVSIPKVAPLEIEDEEEEEEEEEDDDDGDLSKYDLSDWGDLPPNPKKNENNQGAPVRKSRSRSRSPHEKRK